MYFDQWSTRVQSMNISRYCSHRFRLLTPIDIFPTSDPPMSILSYFSHRTLTTESEIERLNGLFVGNLMRRHSIFMCAWWQLAQEERSSPRSYRKGPVIQFSRAIMLVNQCPWDRYFPRTILMWNLSAASAQNLPRSPWALTPSNKN